jgi:hypothetical protein
MTAARCRRLIDSTAYPSSHRTPASAHAIPAINEPQATAPRITPRRLSTEILE